MSLVHVAVKALPSYTINPAKKAVLITKRLNNKNKVVALQKVSLTLLSISQRVNQNLHLIRGVDMGKVLEDRNRVRKLIRVLSEEQKKQVIIKIAGLMAKDHEKNLRGTFFGPLEQPKTMGEHSLYCGQYN